MIVRLALAEFRPDLTQASGYLQTCNNAIPSADGRYRPLRDIQEFSDALPAAFKGGYSAISSDGTGFLLAGTATNLYSLAAGAWSSLVGSLTINGRWRFQQFGDYVVAVNGSATRELDLGAGTDSAIAGAPTATSIWVVGDYVCIGQADGEINKIATSAFRDHTGWTPGTDQSTELSFQAGGAVQGGVGGEYGVILQRERIVRQTRTGDATAPFQYDVVTDNFGCSSGSTIASAGRTVFFHSDRGFVALDDGQALRAIGSEKVDRFFADRVDRSSFDGIFTAVDPENSLVMWGVPGSPGLLLIYDFELDRWATGEFPFTGLMAGFTTSTTLEALAVTYTDLDAMTIPLDDGRWSGGSPRMYFFDQDNKAGTLTGDTLAAQFSGGFGELIPGDRARIRGLRPITDAISGVGVTIDARQRLGDSENRVSADDIGTSGTMPIRTTGRYIAPDVTFDADTDWSYIAGLEFECSAGGKR